MQHSARTVRTQVMTKCQLTFIVALAMVVLATSGVSSQTQQSAKITTSYELGKFSDETQKQLDRLLPWQSRQITSNSPYRIQPTSDYSELQNLVNGPLSPDEYARKLIRDNTGAIIDDLLKSSVLRQSALSGLNSFDFDPRMLLETFYERPHDTIFGDKVQTVIRSFSSDPKDTKKWKAYVDLRTDLFLVQSQSKAIQGEQNGTEAEQSARGFGMSWQSAAVYGLADFIVQRAEAELVISFLENMSKAFNDSATIGKLFPHTYELLRQVADNQGVVSLFPINASLRAVLILDLKELPGSIARNFLQGETRELVDAAMNLVCDLESGVQFSHALRTFTLHVKPGVAAKPLKITIWRASAICTSIHSRFENGDASLRIPFESDVTDTEQQLAVIYDIIRTAGIEIDNGLEEQIKSRQSEVWQLMRSVMSSCNRLIAFGRSQSVDANASKQIVVTDPSVLDTYVGMIVDALQLSCEICNSQANADAASFIKQVRGVQLIYSGLRTGAYQQSTIAALSLMMSATATRSMDEKTRIALYKYLTFAAAIASATSSDDVNSALKACALPVGSYRDKHASKYWMGVVAYAGAAGAGEHAGLNANNQSVLAVGAFVPVGVEATRGKFGILIHIVDLGAIASYRTSSRGNDGETVVKDPEIGFSQIFSPGLYLTWSPFKSVPLTIGAGAQITPLLREVTQDGITSQESMLRWPSIFVGIDIPLLKFAGKS